MPQVQLFGRRWKASTDTLPVLAFFLTIFHACLLVPLIILVTVIESGDYICNVKIEVDITVISILCFQGASLILDRALSWVGWRGGPFEEKKRWLMRPLLYLMIIFLFCTIGFTSYGTYLANSPKVADSCWSKTPCTAIENYVPGVCLEDLSGTGVVLTDDCVKLLYQEELIDMCNGEWLSSAGQWASVAYDPTLYPSFNFDEDFSSCFAVLNPDVQEILETRVNLTTAVTRALQPEYLPDALRNSFRFLLDSLSIPYDYERPYYGTPWSHCLDQESCSAVYNSTCEQWDIFVRLPGPGNQKGIFTAAIYTSWAMIGLTLLLFLLAFNACPDYASADSWAQTIEEISRLLCWSSHVAKTTDTGLTASEEIGNVLHKLFGGIDMDLTDRILGAYLASERMRWRRITYIQNKLEAKGFKPVTTKEKSRMSRFFDAVTRYRLDTEELQVSMDEEKPDGEEAREFGKSSDDASSLFDALDSNSNFQEESNDSYPSPSMDPLPSLHILQSLPRLGTSHSFEINDQSGDRTLMETKTGYQSKQMRIKRLERRIVTPVDLSSYEFSPRVSNIEAAQIYMQQSRWQHVPNKILEEALHYLPFAEGAYGLQNKLWHRAKGSNTMANWINSFLDSRFCAPFSTTLSLDQRVRMQNTDAICRLTGIPTEDIALSSFVSSSFGLLPYMIVLDKISKSIVISIRGTVGYADLVTDMLSAPVDVGSILPDWVWEEIPTNPDGSLVTLFGHSGILASTKTILKDMEDKGLIGAMLGCCSSQDTPRSGGTLDIEACSKPVRSDENDSNSCPYRRAREILFRNRLANSNWGVVVTGHSLGAAVATMLSFKLKQYFPLLKCYAFSPPGGLLSPELSIIAQSYCTSIVVGYDVVSRLSLKTVQDLVDDMVSALCRCKRPKLSILFDHILDRRCDPSSAPKTFASFESLGPDILQILKQYLAKSQLHQEDLDSKPLCPAGKVVFMRPFTAEHQGHESEEYWDAVYIKSDELLKEGLVLTRNSLDHHRLTTVRNSIECILSKKQSPSI
eukprot:jgi/Picsp_1/2185/NSC_05650-R1_sn1-specific diacylglycerol lipase alpha-like